MSSVNGVQILWRWPQAWGNGGIEWITEMCRSEAASSSSNGGGSAIDRGLPSATGG